MAFKAALIAFLAAFLVAEASAQIRLSSFNRECFRRLDCGYNQNCVMYDFYNYPSMWPPCPHYGYCDCVEGTVMISNGTCVPYIQLQLGDRCYGQANERYDVIMYRCDGSRIVCNLPYILQGGYCQVPVQTYPTYASIFYTQPRTIWVPPVTAPAITVPAFVVVNYREACDSGRRICDAARGLCCTQRGPTNSYSQCLCCNKQNVFDEGLGYCRPRVYGDLCTETEECGSGLISNTGYECRLGRCRCVAGYDPVDNLYWNETAKSTYSRRICVVSGAVHWVPTGQTCTMNPEQWAQFNSTRVCHRRAFCHLCYRERNAVSANGGTAVTGTCRELTCGQGGECQAGANGIGMTCNRWEGMVDPPCDNGMCGCGGAGLYMDRFSRCAPYRKLQLGDRCIPDNTGLNMWYTMNEDWDDTQTCVDQGVGQGGYPGYAWGVVKCKLPLVEDYDGTCRHNDDLSGILYATLNYMDQCDDADNRIPIARCDSSRGLVCRNKRCDCTGGSLTTSGAFGAFIGSGVGYTFWDGNRCRTRDFGDQCNQTTQCQSGSYYASGIGGGVAGVCYQGVCTCGSNYQPVDIGSLSVDVNTGDMKQNTRKYCMRNFTVVSKGAECHLDPIAFSSKFTDSYRYGPAIICAPGLFCIRCPADFAPDDEARGVCRSYSPPPPAAGQPCDGGPQVRQILPPSPQWNGYVEPAPVRTAVWSQWQPPVVWQAWQPPVVWSAWQPPVVWTAWQPPVVWTAWQPPVVWSTWVPPVVWSAWQPPVVWAAWQPPPVWSAWQPPPVWSTYLPPVVWTTWNPPPVWTAWQPPPVWSTWLPPVVWSTYLPPVVWTTWVPPVVWTVWVAPVPQAPPPPPPQAIIAAPPPVWVNWQPRVPSPPLPIIYAPPTQQLWNTWSAWCRNAATPTLVSHVLLASTSAVVLFMAQRH